MQIVLARIETGHRLAETRRRDLGERDRYEEVQEAKAVNYTMRARKHDLEAARQFAEREGYEVFTYEGERDPLAKARADMMKLHHQRQETKTP